MLEIEMSQVINSLDEKIIANQKKLNTLIPLWHKENGQEIGIRYIELCFYILSIDTDIRSLLSQILKNPELDSILDKYLAQTIYECVVTLPKITNKFLRLVLKNPESVKTVISVEEFKKQVKIYKMKITEISSEPDYKAIKTIRDHVAAHHIDEKDELSNFILWWEVRQDMRAKNMTIDNNLILKYAAQIGIALDNFSNGIQASFDTAVNNTKTRNM